MYELVSVGLICTNPNLNAIISWGGESSVEEGRVVEGAAIVRTPHSIPKCVQPIVLGRVAEVVVSDKSWRQGSYSAIKVSTRTADILRTELHAMTTSQAPYVLTWRSMGDTNTIQVWPINGLVVTIEPIRCVDAISYQSAAHLSVGQPTRGVGDTLTGIVVSG